MCSAYDMTDDNLDSATESNADFDGTLFRRIGRIEVDEEARCTSGSTFRRQSRIVLDSEFSDGLEGLEPGDRLMVVFEFHLSPGFALLQHPRGDSTRPKRGVFALRSPHRPNPIGVTVVEILEIIDNVVLVTGLDARDGSPVLDLKPAQVDEQ